MSSVDNTCHVVCVLERWCKPPNRKKHDEDVAQCNITIQSKESQLVSTASGVLMAKIIVIASFML